MKITTQVVKTITTTKARARWFDGFRLGEVSVVDLVEVVFTGGARFVSQGGINPDGSARCMEYEAISVGDSFQLMVLPCGLVVHIRPEALAHLPIDLLDAYTPGRN